MNRCPAFGSQSLMESAAQAIDYAVDIHPEKNEMFIAGKGQDRGA